MNCSSDSARQARISCWFAVGETLTTGSLDGSYAAQGSIVFHERPQQMAKTFTRWGRHRDNQRSRVYAWERRFRERWGTHYETIDEAAAWLAPIWRSERGRVGLAKQRAPMVARPHRGQRAALAHDDHRITLPRWARSQWIILHEAAHRLTPDDEPHGPRFVGVLMGLLCRRLDLDADELMRAADEAGVRYHVRSIGVVPVHGPAWHLERVLRAHGPMTEMMAACHLGIIDNVRLNWKQVRGASLSLIKRGVIRRWRGKLAVLDQGPTTALA
jgi:hypothetical protein